MAIDQRVRAGKIWPHLVHAASSHGTMTYADLGPRVGTPHRNLDKPLHVIADYCTARGLPPLAVLVVNGTSGQPGAGLAGGDDVEAGKQRVYAHDWKNVVNPFGLFVSTK